MLRISFLSASYLLVVGIFGMNLKSYLEEQVVFPIEPLRIDFLCLFLLIQYQMFMFSFWIYTVCILANDGRDYFWCCCGIFSYVFLSQGAENILSFRLW